MMTGTWLDRNRHVVFASLVIITLGGAGAFYWWRPAQTSVEIVSAEISPTPILTVTPTPTPVPVRVYVTGAVVNSDVYFLSQGSIVKDAILAAGGFTSDADPEGINQALELQDQQQIHIPRIGEENAPPPVQGGSRNNSESVDGPGSVSGGVINLNTASLEELDALPGIGPAIAGRILDYREKIGGFKGIEQLTEVSGIGQATLAKIRDLVTVK